MKPNKNKHAKSQKRSRSDLERQLKIADRVIKENREVLRRLAD